MSFSLGRYSLYLAFSQMLPPNPQMESPRWTPTDLADGAVAALAADGDQVLSLLCHEQGTSSVYRTASAGAHWEPLGIGLPAGTHVTAITASPEGFYAGTLRRGVFSAEREGGRWRPAGAGFPEHEAILSLAAQGRAVLAGTMRAGVYRSVGGGPWTPMNEGLPLGGRNLAVPALAIGGDYALVSHSFGLHRSTDGGERWQALSTGLPVGRLLSALQVTADQTLLAGGASGLYRSDDDGATWTALRPFARGERRVGSLAAWGRLLFVGVHEPAGARVYGSMDGGRTWHPIGAGLLPGALGSSPLAISGGYLLAGAGPRGVWRRRLTAKRAAGHEAPSPPRPPAFTLLQNAPNPFGKTTTISYELQRPARATLDVTDVRERLVRRIVDAPHEAGMHLVAFDAEELPEGFYTCRLTVGAASQSRQMLLLR